MTTEPSEVVKGIVEDTLNHPWEKVFNEGKTKWNINVNMLSGHLEGIAHIATLIIFNHQNVTKLIVSVYMSPFYIHVLTCCLIKEFLCAHT